ncbi:pilus assembly protein TadG-related protein [Hyalangium sp.]|uniref:pilus assembly protein TadG-related protein n=1 Tax=Hyalangium sp. TaxID=2028555 RepID=UPI002D4E1DB1|nr:pilus assembly protein TadG-related protein [Hyalangium sp.]HYH99138.1 pilus assembly protein TadG-related protein [Hyalangium sp.]
MFTRVLRQSFRRQEGQALVVAALLVLLMSLAVLTTVNLGHTIHERVRLQNTADAAAYSMAAMEARAFNFYAYANRTQVSHYVSAMMWQSLLSLIYFTEAFVTDIYGFMRTINPCSGDPDGAFWTVACPILENVVPYLSQIMKVIDTFMNTFKNLIQGFQQILRTANPDWLIGRMVIPTHRMLNSAMFFASQVVMMATLTQVSQTTDSVIYANDKNVDSKLGQLAAGALSACIFDKAHFRESGDSPLALAHRNPLEPIDPRKKKHSDKEARAKRVMGAITNATRYACDSDDGSCPEGFITSRKLGDLIPLPDGLGVIRDLLSRDIDTPFFKFAKYGQTRFLTANNPNAAKVSETSSPYTPRNTIRDWNDGIEPTLGRMAQGDNLGSDELYWIKFGPTGFGPFRNPFACAEDDDPRECWGDPREGYRATKSDKLTFKHAMKTSIWAMNEHEGSHNNGGVHWRVHHDTLPAGDSWLRVYRPSGPESEIGVHRSKVCVTGKVLGSCPPFVPEIDVFTANVMPAQDGNHPWKGIVPFMHFEPGQYADTCGGTASSDSATRYKHDFNQPSTWVALNKTADQMTNASHSDHAGTGSNAIGLLNGQGKVQWKFSSYNAALEMKNDRMKFLDTTEGLNVISRGQTYYHRPGNWAEQPNFFNPYWRPRLASVYQGRHSLPFVGELVDRLPGELKNVPPKIITH